MSLHCVKVWEAVHALILGHQVDNLKYKTKRYFFIEYSSLSKGYVWYDPIDNETTKCESRHVKFFEDRFDCEEYLEGT